MGELGVLAVPTAREHAPRRIPGAPQVDELERPDVPSLEREQVVRVALLGLHRHPARVRLHALGKRIPEREVVARRAGG